MRKIRLHSVLIFLFFQAHAQSLTFNGASGPVNDYATNSFPVIVSGINPASIDTNYGIKKVCINLTHTWDADLSIFIQSPSGTFVELSVGNGGDGDDYDSTSFMMTAAIPINAGAAPFHGEYIPQGLMGTFNNGQNPNGVWTIYANDTYWGDAGFMFDCSITFDTMPPNPFAFSSSNLPLIKINTGTNIIQDITRITADMGIINNAPALNFYNDPSNDYNGKISIEYRGSSSGGFPQKSYSLTTIDLAGNNLDDNLIGMPSEHDWVLYAPYDDKSLMRNTVIYEISNKMGRYAPRCRFVELFVNEQYEGVYVLMEKIKRDSMRVDVANLDSLNDVSGNELTGGYIIKIDKTTGNFNDGWFSTFHNCDDTAAAGPYIYYQYHYPKGPTMNPVQKIYIQEYVDSFEVALHDISLYDTTSGWRKYFSENAAIDFSIMNEVAKNIDGYRLSTYMHKDKGGRLKMGPLWDFNLAFGNADYLEGWSPYGWYWELSCAGGEHGSPFWWYKLWADSTYKKNYACRWNYFRQGTLETNSVLHIIDSLANYLSQAEVRHFQRWPILGVYTWPNAYVPVTWGEEIDTLKGWYVNRLSWMDSQLPTDSTCAPVSVNDIDEGPLTGYEFKIFPNPALANGYIALDAWMDATDAGEITLYSITGSILKNWKIPKGVSGSFQYLLSFRELNLSPGAYFVRLRNKDVDITRKLILE